MAAFVLLSICPAPSNAAEKDISSALIEAARLNIGNLKSRAGDGKLVSTEMGMANSYLGKAEYLLEKGRNFLGTVSEEAQQEIRHQTTLADIAVAVGNSRLERAKVETELASLGARVEKVKARVKVFDDYRSEIARLKAEIARSAASSKALASMKDENASLLKQVEKLAAERDLLAAQLEEAKKAIPREPKVQKPSPSDTTESMKPEVIMEIAPPVDKQ